MGDIITVQKFFFFHWFFVFEFFFEIVDPPAASDRYLSGFIIIHTVRFIRFSSVKIYNYLQINDIVPVKRLLGDKYKFIHLYTSVDWT